MSVIEPPDPSVRITGVSAGQGRSPIIGDLTTPPRTTSRGAPSPVQPIVVVVELDSSFPGGLREQQKTFEALW